MARKKPVSPSVDAPSTEKAEIARYLELLMKGLSPEAHKTNVDSIPAAKLTELMELVRLEGEYGYRWAMPGNPLVTALVGAPGIRKRHCLPIAGSEPRVCPRAVDRLPTELLPEVERAFRRLRMINDEQTVLWTGNQHNVPLADRCMFERGCDCFAGDARLVIDDDTSTITIDGLRSTVKNPKAFALYRALAADRPMPLTKASLCARVPGCKGRKSVPAVLQTLPPRVRDTVVSGPGGYSIRLPLKTGKKGAT